uniref:synaptosomal-associated protein 47-like isoform X1 n=2 Tax=Oncorhynchus gorbuscha TaxID=8017 RepID=UPI001EAE96FF|nr:synaptosomal-associated protein 47-like isoform X1 [Oncorhynchus gorbuscha]XP_046177307.1 synaptosomal-associated protein 47-like isoform X1 [Oncorhynchus gorbuscha]XP_046177308.1 synaptosomal-associated protein 47-like isoform X1 [Oncorhynchus gorbuscha]XP_046177309.1 synaptosomal-associated protein 47-like isoform X1 [Oncorhynchus gorbuscha]
MTSPNRDIPIHSWPGSYYINSEKRWEAGTLSLTRTILRFTSDQSKENLVGFRLTRIMEIKMESSSFIFSTLTVLEQGNLKHWFGSLRPNRLVVYNVLEHFWRERLLSPSTEVQGGEAQPTKGRELINLVAGAQRRLEDTGNVLHHQGEQFDNVMQGLDKIDSDLGVADKLLSELQSPPWWPFGKLPWKSQQDANAEHAAREATCKGTATGKHRVITSIPAIVSRRGDSDLKPGCLMVMVSSLEVRDTNYVLLHRFERDEVDDIRVHNPYEISVRQRFIGKPDICFRLLSAKMPEAMSVLEMQYKKKVEYTSEYSAFKTTPATTPCDQNQVLIWNAGLQQYQETEVPSTVPAGELSQVHLHVLKPEVTQDEVQELRQMLMQLKNLALEAETELEKQDESLDVLTTSTDQATMDIDKHTCHMKRLLCRCQ